MGHLNNEQGLPAVDSGNYLSAQKHAFAFCDIRKKSEKISERNEQVISKMEEPPTTAKSVLSISALIVAILLACIEGANLSNALASALPIGAGIAFCAGAVFSLIGVLAGEMLAGLKKDPFTNKYRYTGRWYAGLFMALAYLVLQYVLSAVAGGGEMGMLPLFCLLIGVLEILVGLLFTKNALVMAGVMVNNLRLTLMRKKLKLHSRKTEGNWQRHLFEVQTHNHKTGSNVPHGVETEAIAESRAYYNSGGFQS